MCSKVPIIPAKRPSPEGVSSQHTELTTAASALQPFCEDNPGMQDAPTPPSSAPESPKVQTRNPLHGLTLENIVTQLADFYGWDDLGVRIPIRCFTHDPSINSSLKFLRKTPWAREKVESLYLFMLRDQKRQSL